ncbi:hypothetical protein C8Q72DRAFT_344505 [Fomitopsis betulina]|nr:hypothetical protein C8Q72DRAFT_344505 [Fomitopsis betulina]
MYTINSIKSTEVLQPATTCRHPTSALRVDEATYSWMPSRGDVILAMTDDCMQQIIRREKTYEFRKYMLNASVKRVWFYLKAPYLVRVRSTPRALVAQATRRSLKTGSGTHCSTKGIRAGRGMTLRIGCGV